MRVIDTATPPGKGGWVYIDPETKVRFQHPYFTSLKHIAAKHRRANQLPIPVNWDQFFEANICDNTTWGKCEPEEKSLRGVFHLAKKFASEMANWAKSGFDTVDKETLQHRFDICQGNLDKAMDPCQYWGGHTSSALADVRSAAVQD